MAILMRNPGAGPYKVVVEVVEVGEQGPEKMSIGTRFRRISNQYILLYQYLGLINLKMDSNSKDLTRLSSKRMVA